ncbi:MAG: glycosyltransferase, partial [Nanoarchaeota archaeon]|nr:glycosyltransferase [Nanoarchaeota archaeon]
CVLITAADKNYLEQAKQLFSSVYYNSGWPGDYMLLSYDIPEKDLKWFRDKGIIVRKDKTKIKEKNGNLPPVIFSRYLIFKPYFKRWKNVIFLDSDIIVRASLNKLVNVKGFAAVQDPLLLKEQIRNSYSKALDSLGKRYDLSRRSFNAGLLAFDTRIIKKDSFKTLLELTKKYNNISKYDDQTVLNIYFYNKWQNLPLIFNVNPGIYLSKIKKSRQKDYFKKCLLHFYGENKPWKADSPYKREWNENLEKAEFIDLKNRPLGRPNLNNYQLKKILAILKARRFYLEKIDKNIGLIGIKIKKISPKTYKTIKSWISR